MIEKYKLLIARFVGGKITAEQFESAYLEVFKNEVNTLPNDAFVVLNKLFLDVDEYCGDPTLRDDEDLDDEMLMSSAKEALKKLV